MSDITEHSIPFILGELKANIKHLESMVEKVFLKLDTYAPMKDLQDLKAEFDNLRKDVDSIKTSLGNKEAVKKSWMKAGDYVLSRWKDMLGLLTVICIAALVFGGFKHYFF